MNATTTTHHAHTPAHTRHAAHANAWRVLYRAARDRPSMGYGGPQGRLAVLDARIEEKVRDEVEKMAAVARRFGGI